MANLSAKNSGEHSIQVHRDHYLQSGYNKRERWANFWRQINLVHISGARSVLEVGVGSGIVTDALRKIGYNVKTLDIDPNLNPDVVGSVTSISLPDDSVDMALAAEVLEHLPWSDVKSALSELRRVSRTHIAITLPYAGSIITLRGKVPLVPWFSFMIKIPHFRKRHEFDGQHYWELGKKGTSLRKFRALARTCGLSVQREGHSPDDPNHYYFLFVV